MLFISFIILTFCSLKKKKIYIKIKETEWLNILALFFLKENNN